MCLGCCFVNAAAVSHDDGATAGRCCSSPEDRDFPVNEVEKASHVMSDAQHKTSQNDRLLLFIDELL